MIGLNKYEAKDSETPRSPSFHLARYQTLDINLKCIYFWDYKETLNLLSMQWQ